MIRHLHVYVRSRRAGKTSDAERWMAHTRGDMAAFIEMKFIGKNGKLTSSRADAQIFPSKAAANQAIAKFPGGNQLVAANYSGGKDAEGDPRLSRSAIATAAKVKLPMVKSLFLERGGSNATGYYYYIHGEFKPYGKSKRSIPITGSAGGIYVHRVGHLTMEMWVNDIIERVMKEWKQVESYAGKDERGGKDAKFGSAEEPPPALKGHSQFTRADYDYLRNRGYSNSDIKQFWDIEKRDGKSPQQHARAPDIVGYLAKGFKKGGRDADPSSPRYQLEKEYQTLEGETARLQKELDAIGDRTESELNRAKLAQLDQREKVINVRMNQLAARKAVLRGKLGKLQDAVEYNKEQLQVQVRKLERNLAIRREQGHSGPHEASLEKQIGELKEKMKTAKDANGLKGQRSGTSGFSSQSVPKMSEVKAAIDRLDFRWMKTLERQLHPALLKAQHGSPEYFHLREMVDMLLEKLQER